MTEFDEFLSHATRSTAVSIADRPGMDALIYMPAVLFPGDVAISEPLIPAVRGEDTQTDKTETPFEAAQYAFVVATGFEQYETTGNVHDALTVINWIRGSTVSTPEGRQRSSHCAAEARLMAYLHYRQFKRGSDIVSVTDVLPTILRLLGISQQPEVLDFVLSRMPPNSTVALVGLRDFMEDVRDATRPPRWPERKNWKWANVRQITDTYLRLTRHWNTEEALAAVDQAIASGTPPLDAVAPLYEGRPFGGRKAAFHAYSSLSLLDFERKPKPWENGLADEVIACAADTGFSSAVAANRRLSAILAAAEESRNGAMASAPAGAFPLPAGFEEAWIAVGAGSLALPESVSANSLSTTHAVALALGELALANSVSRAYSARFGEPFPTIDNSKPLGNMIPGPR